MDLLDFFRGVHSWRRLDSFIRRLPRRSRFNLAQADDEELAEQFVDELDKPATAPPLDEYGPEVQRLDRLTLAVESLVALTVSERTGKAPPKVKPPRQPETAADRVRARKRAERHDSLVAEVLAAQQRHTRT